MLATLMVSIIGRPTNFNVNGNQSCFIEGLDYILFILEYCFIAILFEIVTFMNLVLMVSDRRAFTDAE